MTMPDLRILILALVAMSVLAGCAAPATTAFSQDDECRRAGGFWTGSKCDYASGGGGGGGY